MQKSVTVMKEVLINLGSYQNHRIGVTLEAECGEGESHASIHAVLQNDANLLLVGELRQLIHNQVNTDYMKGRQESTIRSYVKGQSGFDILELIAPGKADELVESLVTTYAAPPPPPQAEVVPEPEQDEFAEMATSGDADAPDNDIDVPPYAEVDNEDDFDGDSDDGYPDDDEDDYEDEDDY